MHYGHPPHIATPNDLTLLKCPNCGWVSKELTRDQIAAKPWYCGGVCGKSGMMFVHFNPSERYAAYNAFGLRPPDADRVVECTSDQEELDRIG